MACSHRVQLVRAALCSKTQLQLYFFFEFPHRNPRRQQHPAGVNKHTACGTFVIHLPPPARRP